jgi:hypothetical protein
MTQWIRWSALGAVVAFVSGCPVGMMRPDAGGAGGGGSLLAGGGMSGVGGGSAGGMMTAGGRAGGQSGGTAGGLAGGSAGGTVDEDAGVDAGIMEPIDGGMLMGGETCEAPVVLPGTPISLMSTTTGLVNDSRSPSWRTSPPVRRCRWPAWPRLTRWAPARWGRRAPRRSSSRTPTRRRARCCSSSTARAVG